jgi:hypothetical protein
MQKLYMVNYFRALVWENGSNANNVPNIIKIYNCTKKKKKKSGGGA